MEGLIDWCGFLGAWALFAGPVYQASLELQEEAFERDRLEVVQRQVGDPQPVSPWWWLVPPVAFVLRRRALRETREEMLRLLDTGDVEDLVNFGNKATGWLLVGLGAFLIATKETFELVEHYEWSLAVFWVLVVVMPLVASSYAAARSRRSEDMLRITEREREQRPGAGAQSGAPR